MIFLKPYDVDTAEHSNKFTQKFDLKETVKKAGKTYCRYDEIQANREDTEIYPTLEKYGNLDVMTRTATEVYDDVSETLTLRDLYEQEIKLKETFESLPLDERRKFDMDFYKFKKDGLDFYKKKAEKEIENAKKAREIEIENQKKPIEVKVVDGGNNEK